MRVTLALLCPSKNAISSTLSPASSARLATVCRKLCIEGSAPRGIGTARLRQLRDHAGITQDQLARTVGIGATYVSQIENGHRGVGWHTVTRILGALGADLHQLADAITESRQSDEQA